MNVRVVVAVALLIGVGTRIDAGERILLRVSPSVSFEPANLVVRTIIESNDENRSMEIIAESIKFYRSSEIPLNGGHAPRTALVEFRGLPSGAYQVRAVLKGVAGREIASVQHNISVVEAMSDSGSR
jgi:hypothetical protein